MLWYVCSLSLELMNGRSWARPIGYSLLSINTHWYSFEKNVDFFFIYKIRIMFLTADNNWKTHIIPSLDLGHQEGYTPGVPSFSSIREFRIRVTLTRSYLTLTQKSGVLVTLEACPAEQALARAKICVAGVGNYCERSLCWIHLLNSFDIVKIGKIKWRAWFRILDARFCWRFRYLLPHWNLLSAVWS